MWKIFQNCIFYLLLEIFISISYGIAMLQLTVSGDWRV